jgi:hypothetical protein
MGLRAGYRNDGDRRPAGLVQSALVRGARHREDHGVIAHEVFHVVNKHHLRRGDRNADLWNVAADLLINRLLEEDNFTLPPDGLFDRERCFAGLPTETIYARLQEEQKPEQSGHAQQQPSETQASTPSRGRSNAAASASHSDIGPTRCCFCRTMPLPWKLL